MPATIIRYFRFMGTSERTISDDRRTGLLQDMIPEWMPADGIECCRSR
jgi:hypothetical protein